MGFPTPRPAVKIPAGFSFAVREWTMHIQIDMLDAQLNDRPDGSIEILGQSGYIVLKAQYADKVKAAYKDFLAAYQRPTA